MAITTKRPTGAGSVTLRCRGCGASTRTGRASDIMHGVVKGKTCRRPGTVWAARVVVSRPGQLRRMEARSFRTRADAESWIKLRQVDRDRGLVSQATISVGAFLLLWIDGLEAQGVSPATVGFYERHVRLRLIPQLGRKQLAKLTPGEIRQAWANLRAKGESDATIWKAYTALSSAMRQADTDDLIALNITHKARPKRPEHDEAPDAWTPTEVRAIFADDAMLADRLYAYWRLIITTGMRRNEALALRWDDVDLDAGLVTVRRSVTQVKGRTIFKSTKTDRVRSVDIPPSVVHSLQDRQMAQFEEIASWTDRRGTAKSPLVDPKVFEGEGPGRLIFTREDGRSVMSDAHVSHMWSKLVQPICLRHGVRYLSIHGMRHTVGTIAALEAGETAAQHLLGHTDGKMTRRYINAPREFAKRGGAAVAAAIEEAHDAA